MSKHLFITALIVGLVAAPRDCRADKSPAPEQKRTVYTIKYGSAKDLTAALSGFFKGEVEVQAITVPGDCLLLSGRPAAVEEAAAVLSRLDRRPRSLVIEVVIVETAKKKTERGKSEAANEELDAKAFSGPADAVLAKVQALLRKGHLARVKRIRLSTLENQPTFSQIRESRPYVTGTGGGFGGRASSQITYKDVGLMVSVTPQVSPDGRVTIEVSVEESRLKAPEDGVQLGTSDNGAPIPAAEFVTSTLRGKLSLPSGRAAVVEEVQTDSKSHQVQTWVIVAARVVEPESERQK